MLEPQQWDRLRELFDEASALDGNARTLLLARIRDEDPAADRRSWSRMQDQSPT